MIVLANSASHRTDLRKGPIRTLPRKINRELASLSQARSGWAARKSLHWGLESQVNVAVIQTDYILIYILFDPSNSDEH